MGKFFQNNDISFPHLLTAKLNSLYTRLYGGSKGYIWTSGTTTSSKQYSINSFAEGEPDSGDTTSQPIASGYRSHAEGNATIASGNTSHAEGLKTISTAQYQHVQGKYNKKDDAQAFIIGGGNSDSETGRKNIFTVDWNGKTCSENGFFQTSDIRKKNILGEIDLNKAYDLIDKCSEVLYTLKDDESNTKQVGMIAQEVREFFPEIVLEDNDGVLSLDYARLTVIILRVIKDLVNRINNLEKELIYGNINKWYINNI